MKVGDRAQVTRTFSKGDVHEYAGLSGYKAPGERVPEPLIGALFSYLLGVELPGMGTMYLKQETCNLSDAVVGEPLTAEVEIMRLRPDKLLADLSTSCRGSDGRVIATGRALVYVGDVACLPDSNG